MGKVRAAVALAGIAACYGFARRTRKFSLIAPELRSPLSRFRTPSVGPLLLRLAQSASGRQTECAKGVEVEARQAVAEDGTKVPVYVYRPASIMLDEAAIFFIHGGGMILGSAPMMHERASGFARDVGAVVVSVGYRLAPRHPFPAPLDDVVTAYRWLLDSAEELKIAPHRIVVTGDSAGAGLAAALCQRVHDEAITPPALQLLFYPMLDDRTAIVPPDDASGQVIWSRGSNLFGWTCYLGRKPQLSHAPDYAAPARRSDLSGLPPAWIGVGMLDLFHREDADYARRLVSAGVTCELVEVDGAFHAFDLIHPNAAISADFRHRALEAVRRAMSPR